MGADINCFAHSSTRLREIDASLCISSDRITARPHTELPGNHASRISPEMLVTDWSKILNSQLIPAHRITIQISDALIRILLPWIHNDSRSINQLAENHAVNRDITKVQSITQGIKPCHHTRRANNTINTTTDESHKKSSELLKFWTWSAFQ